MSKTYLKINKQLLADIVSCTQEIGMYISVTHNHDGRNLYEDDIIVHDNNKIGGTTWVSAWGICFDDDILAYRTFIPFLKKKNAREHRRLQKRIFIQDHTITQLNTRIAHLEKTLLEPGKPGYETVLNHFLCLSKGR